ncbi:MAG: hypothetical protein ACOH2E_03890 [Candidatus Paracaedibacter sp.]
MKIYSIIKYILGMFKQFQTLTGAIDMSKHADCYLDTEIDGKIESYFPGEKLTD